MYNTPFEFVIDTDSYSGNFERELCAYVTGFWDTETHGEDQARQFYEDMGLEYGEDEDKNPFENYVHFVATYDDDVPIVSPQCIEITPKKYNVEYSYSSVGIFFEKEPTPELINLMKERAHKFAREGTIFDEPVKLNILGFRLLKQTVTEEEIEI